MTVQPVPTAPVLDTQAYDETLRREHPWQGLRVEGKVPADLRGTLYRNGPLARESQGAPVDHMFEGDGGIVGVRFGDGVVEGAVRILDTQGRRDEIAAGRPLYGYAAPWLTRMWSNLQGRVKNAANTHVVPWQGELLALYEGAGPTRVDPEDLSVLGESTLGGAVTGAFSAHPHRVASRRASYNFGLNYGRQTRLDLFELPDAGGARRIGEVVLPHATMLHDFAVTERHMVFFVSPIRINILRAMAGLGPVTRLMEWDASAGTEVIVVSIDDPTQITRFQVPAFYQWHFANAFERGDDIVVDFCQYDDFSMEIGDDEEDGGQLSRAIVTPSTEGFLLEARSDAFTEFPHVHPGVEGRRHSVVYTVGSAGGRYRLCRFDDGNAEHFASLDAGQLASEPVIVPRSERENDVWLLSLVFDAAADASFLWVVDGTSMQEQARCWFDQPIPRTFHGSWVSAR